MSATIKGEVVRTESGTHAAKGQDHSTPRPALPVAADSATLIQMISRAASDASVDIDKMERLMQMHERMTARNAEMAFNIAMTACQSEMRAISADAENPQTRSKYASYARLDGVLRPIYTRHGFSLSFDEGDSKPDMVRVVCIVSHIEGHSRSYHRDMPADGKGAKGGDVMTKTHAAGAAGSYGARYLLRGIFNVAIGEQDTDGNAPIEGGLSDNAVADHLSAIEECADIPSLQKAFAAAATAAQIAKDKPSLRKFMDAKDGKKKALAK